MAEETNPWRKQMMSRQNQPSTTGVISTPEPTHIHNLPKEKAAETQGSSPNNPWKNQMQSSPSTAQSSQPSWAKQANTSASSPGTQVNSGYMQNIASWKKPESAITSSPNMSSNPWMKGKIDKEKEEKDRLEREEQEKVRVEEERLRVEAEENEKEKEKQITEEKERLHTEMESEKREQQRMTQEEMLSKGIEEQQRQVQQRQRQERERQQKEEEEEEQKAKKVIKAPPKAANKTKNEQQKVQSPKKKPRQPRIVSDSLEDQTMASRYMKAFQSQFVHYDRYNQKLMEQKHILSTYFSFQKEVEERVKQVVDSHQIPDQMDVPKGISLKFIKTRSVRHEKSNEISYDEGRMDQIKRYMRLSNTLQNALIEVIRKVGVISLRTPLVSLVEYRGIMCLASSQTAQESMQPLIEVSKVSRISDQLLLILKQANKEEPGLKADHLVCRSICNSEGEEVFIICIKEDVNLPQVEFCLKPQQFLRDFNWIQKSLEDICSIASLEKKQLDHEYSQEMLNVIVLAQYITKIYRSGQAELDDENYISIIIRQDKELIQLLSESGFKGEFVQRGILLILVQRMTGIFLEYEKDVFSTGVVRVVEARPIRRGYTFERLELVDVSNRYMGFIQEGKIELAAESMMLRFDLAQIDEDPAHQVSLVLDHSELLSEQEKLEESLREMETIKSKVPPYSLSSLRMMALLIKNYSLLGMETELLHHFDVFVDQMDFVFGRQNHLHSVLYSVLAGFYSKRAHQLSEAVNIYQLALNTDRQLFGESSVESGDLFVSIAQAYLRHSKFQQARQNIDQAVKIYQELDNKMRLVETTVFLSQMALRQGDKRLALEGIEKAIKAYQKANKVNELSRLLLLKLSYDMDIAIRQETIHMLFTIGYDHNRPIITKKALELALRGEISHLSKPKIQALRDLCDTQLEDQETPSLSQFERNLKNFSSVSQLLKWVFSLLDSQSAAQRGQVILKEIAFYLGQEEFDAIII